MLAMARAVALGFKAETLDRRRLAQIAQRVHVAVARGRELALKLGQPSLQCPQWGRDVTCCHALQNRAMCSTNCSHPVEQEFQVRAAAYRLCQRPKHSGQGGGGQVCCH